MQVTNAIEESTTEVLIGRAEEAQGYTVSNDSALMSMLSTGLYENPLKSMIQETLFNAWDAHKMNGSQNKYIDVYVSEAGGLVIRDYGPGIAKEDMKAIYCVYGGSTKRDDDTQTGGFGLGCKAPFSYTESFTVTTNNNGEKSVYLISRMTEALNGKPGFTKMISVPTKETGLMVTIPLKASDIGNTKAYINNILVDSGIKAKIHYKDKTPVKVHSPIIAPDEYKFDRFRNQGIYASYGGVSYQIKSDPFYEQEYEALNKTTRNNHITIGFAPNTLTPLPNRENLNLSTKSTASIKRALQILIGKLRPAFVAITKEYFETSMKKFAKQKIKPQFAISSTLMFNVNDLSLVRPNAITQNIWDVALSITTHYPDVVVKNFLDNIWENLLKEAWTKYYLNDLEMVNHVLTSSAPNKLFSANTRLDVQRAVISLYEEPWQKKLQDFETMLVDFAPKMKMRQLHDTNWSNIRRDIDGKLTTQSGSLLYYRSQLFFYDRVILAKSVRDLNESGFLLSSQFNGSLEGVFHYNRRYSFYEHVIAYVVGTAKGGFDKAKTQLEAQGFKVIVCEAPPKEPTERNKVKKTTYKKFDCGKPVWGVNADYTIDKPTHFVYATKAVIKETRYLSSVMASPAMLQATMDEHPNTIITTNCNQAEALKKSGVISFEDTVKTKLESILKNKIRLRNIVRIKKILENSCFDTTMMAHPKIQKLFGVTIPKDDENFWKDIEFLEVLDRQRYSNIKKSKDLSIRTLQVVWAKDPRKEAINRLIEKSGLFNSNSLSHIWGRVTNTNREKLTTNVVRFIRTK